MSSITSGQLVPTRWRYGPKSEGRSLEVRVGQPFGSFHAYLRDMVRFAPRTAERAINPHRFRTKRAAERVDP